MARISPEAEEHFRMLWWESIPPEYAARSPRYDDCKHRGGILEYASGWRWNSSSMPPVAYLAPTSRPKAVAGQQLNRT